MVGALLALLSGVFASVLLPELTRSWQDRPRELELKRGLVDKISKSAADAVANGNSFGFRRVASAVLASELTTYFAATPIPDRWKKYDYAVTHYLRYMALAEKLPPSFFIDLLRTHFGAIRFTTRADEAKRQSWVAGHSLKQPRLTLGAWLGLERDQIEAQILASDAKGFSHGFWFLSFA